MTDQLSIQFTRFSAFYAPLIARLQQGESPVYVQRQLGHASIKLTVGSYYGKWRPMGNEAAVDRLDDGSGSKVGAGRRGRCGSGGKMW